eukprot:939858-Prorocentrum_minimum.AAC.2
MNDYIGSSRKKELEVAVVPDESGTQSCKKKKRPPAAPRLPHITALVVVYNRTTTSNTTYCRCVSEVVSNEGAAGGRCTLSHE